MLDMDVVSYLRSNGITKLYHFTDRSNIPSIISNGGLYSWYACEQKGIKISRPGGSDTSKSLDSYKGLANYVRLSFTRNHPMMYVAKNEGRISDPVILEIDLSVAGYSTTKFSDRNAAKNSAIIATGYNGVRNIHLSTVKQSTHFDLGDETQYYQAEVLVYEKIPLSLITNIDNFRPKPQPSYTGSYSGNGGTTSRPSYGGGRPYSYTPSSYRSSSSGSSSSSSNNSSSGGNGCLWVILIGIAIMIIGAISG